MWTNGRRAVVGTAIGALTTLALAGSANAAIYKPNVFSDAPENAADCAPAPSAGAAAPNPGECSLRDAVRAANDTSEDDEVVLSAGTYNLDPHEHAITVWDRFGSGELIIRGQGARETILDVNALLDEVFSRGFTFWADSKGELHDFAITGGTNQGAEDHDAFDGGAIAVQDYNRGGGDAEVLLMRMRLFENHADRDGGAIKNRGKLTIVQSLIDGNTARGSGGGIENDDELSIVNSTITGNEALGERQKPTFLSEQEYEDYDGNGGGIDSDGDHAADDEGTTQVQPSDDPVPANHPYTHIESSTIAFNKAAADGGGVSTRVTEQVPAFRGQGDPITRFHNSIVSNNTSHEGQSLQNCSGNAGIEDGVFQSSEGHNVDDGDSCIFDATGDQEDTDPKLAGLANNGGDTDTHKLNDGSPAIDAGDEADCQAQDQRQEKRPQGATCDAGAYEAPAKPNPNKPATPRDEDEKLPPGIKARDPRCIDSVPPLTRLTRKGLKIDDKGVHLKGKSRDRRPPCVSGVQRVEVSLARVSGTGLNCKFLRRSNRFLLSPFMNCRRSIRFIATGQERWKFTYKVKLRPGKYRATARGWDNVDNKETPKKRRNIIYFRIK